MGSEPTADFERSLARLDVGLSRATPATFAETLAGVTSGPTVGAPLPFEDLSLPEFVDDEPTPAALEAAETGVTAATAGVGEYGSVLLRATPGGTEPVSLFPERHVAVLRAGDVVPDMAAAFERLGPVLRDERASVVVATGPSATADMGELVYGAHGPRTVDVVLVEGGGDGA